jgi:hypothetical protein
MIVSQLKGGLGNQMFQYAAGKSLALRTRTSLALDLSFLEQNKFNVTNRQFALGEFNIRAQLGGIELRNGFNFNANKFVLKFRATFPSFFDTSVFNESRLSRRNSFFDLKENTYLSGYWQDSFYFRAIRNELMVDFQLKHESESFTRVSAEIKNSNSIGLHIRRGDYVTLKSASDFHGILPLEYYKNAVHKITQVVPHPNYFVFSDDVEWCEANLDFLPGFKMVSKYKGLSMQEELMAMSKCKHNIIANSSYSWWASWLNENPNKIVIAPQYWYTKTKTQNVSLLEPNWILI